MDFVKNYLVTERLNFKLNLDTFNTFNHNQYAGDWAASSWAVQEAAPQSTMHRQLNEGLHHVGFLGSHHSTQRQDYLRGDKLASPLLPYALSTWRSFLGRRYTFAMVFNKSHLVWILASSICLPFVPPAQAIGPSEGQRY